MIFTPNYLVPNYRIARVTELSRELLASWGVDALLLDVDGTLKAYRDTRPPDDIATWINVMQHASVPICLVSNGRGARISNFATVVGLPYIALARKPLTTGCRAAIKLLGVLPQHTALVGDQLFTDVIAARRSGIVSILVTPIAPEQEPWFTRIKRPIERAIMKTW